MMFNENLFSYKDKYTLPDGTVLLNTVKECPRAYYLSYIVRKGFPLLPRFDEILLRFFEAGNTGMANYYYSLHISYKPPFFT